MVSSSYTLSLDNLFTEMLTLRLDRGIVLKELDGDKRRGGGGSIHICQGANISQIIRNWS